MTWVKLFLFFCTTINSLIAFKVCRIKERPETGSLSVFLATRRHAVVCLDQEVCCAEGCCTGSGFFFYTYTWEIVVTIMFIFVTVITCVCACYYCKNSCQKSIVLPANTERVQEARTIAGRSLGVSRTPPPPYDVAILLPPVHPHDRVPTYDEVMSPKRF